MDIIGDYTISLEEVVAAFGSHVKFHVKRTSPPPPPPPPQRNAVDVLMASQARFTEAQFPPSVIVVNKRDQLFNDLLSTLKSAGVSWRSSEVENGTATRTIRSLRDTIDGSHDTLAERNCVVPKI